MKILAVDDSFDWLKIHTDELTTICGDDLELISANSAFDALNIYKEEYPDNSFDLVVTDLQMENDFEPMLAGEWLIKEIQELNPEQRILIVSSHFNIDIIADNYGVDSLSKRIIIADPSAYEIKLSEIFI